MTDIAGQELIDLSEHVYSGQHLALPPSGHSSVTPASGVLASNEQSTVRLDFRTRGLVPGNYFFELLISSNDPHWVDRYLPIRLAVEEVVGVTTGTDKIPETARLFQNYPNPFNPVTTIAFHIAEQEQARLIVYNTLGQAVRSLG